MNICVQGCVLVFSRDRGVVHFVWMLYRLAYAVQERNYGHFGLDAGAHLGLRRSLRGLAV